MELDIELTRSCEVRCVRVQDGNHGKNKQIKRKEKTNKQRKQVTKLLDLRARDNYNQYSNLELLVERIGAVSPF